MDLVIDVGKQIDGFTFRLNPKSKRLLRCEAAETPASSLSISHDTVSDFSAFGGGSTHMLKQIHLMLTGLSDEALKKQGFVQVVLFDTKTQTELKRFTLEEQSH